MGLRSRAGARSENKRVTDVGVTWRRREVPEGLQGIHQPVKAAKAIEGRPGARAKTTVDSSLGNGGENLKASLTANERDSFGATTQRRLGQRNWGRLLAQLVNIGFVLNKAFD